MSPPRPATTAPGVSARRLLLPFLAVLAASGGPIAPRAAGQSSALEAPPTPTVAPEWVHLGASSGLPSTRVLDLMEDDSGTLWAATEEGIAHFDAYHWLPSEAARLLGSETTIGFVRTQQGELLFACERGLQRCLDGRLETIEVLGADEGRRCIGLASDSGAGWVALFADAEGQLSAVAGTRTAQRALPLPISELQAVSQPSPLVDCGAQAPLLIAEEGIYRLDPEGWRLLRPTTQGWHVQNAISTADGATLLIVDYPFEDSGLWSIERGQLSRIEGAATHPAISLVRSRAGAALTLRSSGQLLVLRDGLWSPYLMAPPNLDRATCATVRADGTIVVGTLDGIFFAPDSEPRWTHDPLGDYRSQVADIHRASDGVLWIVSNHGIGRQREAGAAFEWTDSVLGRDLWGLTGVAEDARGDIWICGGRAMIGALRWDGSEWKHFGAEQGLPSSVHRMELDRNGLLWFLCLSADDSPYSKSGPGPIAWNGSGFERFGPSDSLPSGRVYCFGHGLDGSYWFGHSAGLSRHLDGEWEHWDTEGGARALANPRVFSLAIDASGKVWFTHQTGGIGFLRPDGSVGYLRRSDGLIGDSVWELRVDQRDWLWATTQDGLAIVRAGEVISIDYASGLHMRNLWPILPEEQRVTIGSMGSGLAVLDLDAASNDPPLVIIKGPHLQGDRLELSWQAFAHGATSSPESLETRRRLDEGAWSPWSRQRNWVSPPLDSGSHTIEIEARSLLGERALCRTKAEIPVVSWKRPLVYGPVLALCIALALGLSVHESRKRRLHAQLRSSEERYRDLVENAGLPIYTHDLDGKLIDLNRKAEEVLGLARRQARGRALEDFVPEPQREALRAHLAEVRETVDSPDVYELTLQTPGGGRRMFEAHTRLIRREGLPLGMQSVALEITTRKGLEEELAQIRKMEAIGQLAGGIAHDFNNVLLVVNGHCELLLKELPPASAQSESVAAILQAGERAAGLTRELLAYSRKQVMKPEHLDLNLLLSNMAQTLLRLLGEDIQLNMDLCQEPAIIKADPGQLQQVLLNLGVNARDAMPRGGQLSIESRIQEPQADKPATTPGAGARAGWVVLSVGDSGHGMDEATRRRIFDPFFTTKEPGKGTGLGLASVYGIVQQSGGYIHVSSAPGQGAVFRIFLRREESAGETLVDIPTPNTRAGVQGRRVLLVEDEPQVRSLLRQTLQRAGFEVVEARDGELALQLARSSELPFEIVVTDVVMPSMSGPALVRQLEELGLRPKVIFVSGYSGDALERYGAVHGEHRHLQKPFRAHELIELVHGLLNSPGRPSSHERV